MLYEEADHSLCNAHLLRDLTGVIENDDQLWAVWMIDLLLAGKTMVETTQEADPTATTLSDEQLHILNGWYDRIVQYGFGENPLPDQPPPEKGEKRSKKKSKARNLVERFDKQKEEILRFTINFDVPFDNNLAERDLRMMKVQQKVSGCFRSTAGAEQFCQLRSYTSTLRKQGINVWDALKSLFTGDVVQPTLNPTPV